jgi:hypothetical protein
MSVLIGLTGMTCSCLTITSVAERCRQVNGDGGWSKVFLRLGEYRPQPETGRLSGAPPAPCKTGCMLDFAGNDGGFAILSIPLK